MLLDTLLGGEAVVVRNKSELEKVAEVCKQHEFWLDILKLWGKVSIDSLSPSKTKPIFVVSSEEGELYVADCGWEEINADGKFTFRGVRVNAYNFTEVYERGKSTELISREEIETLCGGNTSKQTNAKRRHRAFVKY